MRKLCFLDMDGVIINFIKGICRAHGRPDPYKDPVNFGNFRMDEIWGLSSREFWAPANEDPSFWDSLERMADADEIVKTLITVFGTDNIAILTAPSSDRECVPGKRRSIKKHYPMFGEQIIFAHASAKKFLAGPDRWLIDDRDENVDEFRAAGGNAVQIPRPWNRRSKLAAARPSDYLRYEIGL